MRLDLRQMMDDVNPGSQLACPAPIRQLPGEVVYFPGSGMHRYLHVVLV
ncbi:MAG: hypothetical protein HY319_32610 [Armatimonadetes bacterium]|nr:hypothetical protein [Armatimonadota bacterium]